MAVSDSEVLAVLSVHGWAVADYFLIGDLVCHESSPGELAACAIDDPELAAAAKAFLRRIGARGYGSYQEYSAQHVAGPCVVRKAGGM
jgi:hypothetical protein